MESILIITESSQLIWLYWKNCLYSSLPFWIPTESIRVLKINGGQLETLCLDESQAAMIFFSLYSLCFHYIHLVYTLGIYTGVYTSIYTNVYTLWYICWCLVIYTPMYIPVYTLVYILCTLVIYTTLRFMQRPSSEIRS